MNPSLDVLKQLQRLPNVGPSVARDLVRLGIRSVEQLAEQEPDELYLRLGHMDGQLHDPCLWDTFAAIIAIARGKAPKPWWFYTPIRKKRQQRGNFPRTL